MVNEKKDVNTYYRHGRMQVLKAHATAALREYLSFRMSLRQTWHEYDPYMDLDLDSLERQELLEIIAKAKPE